MSKNGLCPDQVVLEDQRNLAMVMGCVMVKGQEEVMESAVATEDTKGSSVWSALMDTSTRKEMTLTPFVQVSYSFKFIVQVEQEGTLNSQGKCSSEIY